MFVFYSIFSHYYCATGLCRPRYASYPSVRPSVCLSRSAALNSTTKKRRKTFVGAEVSAGSLIFSSRGHRISKTLRVWHTCRITTVC